MIVQLFTQNDLLIYKMLFNQCINNKFDAQKLIQRISKKMLVKKGINKQKKKIALNNLLNCIIGSVASYLHQFDYTEFSKTNRKIYIACNTPNMLQTLNLNMIRPFTKVPIELYTSIKYLELSIAKFIDFNLDRHCNNIFLKLKTLKLNGQCIYQNKLEKFYENNDLWNKINCLNITTLILSDFGPWIAGYMLTMCICKFKNLTCLKLNNIQNDVAAQSIKQHCPEIVELVIEGPDNALSCYCIKNLIHSYSDNLTGLQFNEYPTQQYDYEFSRLNFAKLQYFQGQNIHTQTINDIISTTRNLKHFSVNIRVQNSTSIILRNMMQKVIKLNKWLQHIEFVCDINSNRGIKSVLNGIRNGFQNRKINNTNKIIISIYTTYFNTNNACSLIFRILKLINFLKNSQIQHFMIIWHENNKQVDKQLLINKLKCNLSKVSILFQDNHLILISNEKCNINGFNMKRLAQFNVP